MADIEVRKSGQSLDIRINDPALAYRIEKRFGGDFEKIKKRIADILSSK